MISNLGLEYARQFVKNIKVEREDFAINKRININMATEQRAASAERIHWEGLAMEASDIESALMRLLVKYERELRFGELCHLDRLRKASKAGWLNTWASEFAAGGPGISTRPTHLSVCNQRRQPPSAESRGSRSLSNRSSSIS